MIREKCILFQFQQIIILLVSLHITLGGSLVTVEHYNQPAEITYASSNIPIGLRAGPAIYSPSPISAQQQYISSPVSSQYTVRNKPHYAQYSARPIYGPAPGAEGLLPPFRTIVLQSSTPSEKYFSHLGSFNNLKKTINIKLAPVKSYQQNSVFSHNNYRQTTLANIQPETCNENHQEETEVISSPVFVDSKTVRRPAIQKDFFDIEERTIVRPAGSAVIQFEQHHDLSDRYPGTLVYSHPIYTHPSPPIYSHQFPTYDVPVYRPIPPTQPPITYIPPSHVPVYPDEQDSKNNNHGFSSNTPCAPANDDNSSVHNKSPTLTNDKTDGGVDTVDADLDDVEQFDNAENDQYDDDVVIEGRTRPFNNTNFVDIVYTKNATTPHIYSNTASLQNDLQRISTYTIRPQSEPNDPLKYEIPVRGDISTASEKQQTDKFYHEIPRPRYVFPVNVESKSNGAAPKIATITFSQSSQNEHRENQQKLLNLFAVKGGVTEIGSDEKSNQRYQTNNNNINVVRARVVSVTPAPNLDEVQPSEHTKIRRIVVSKPIETVEQIEEEQQQLIQVPHGGLGTVQKLQTHQKYVTPVPQNLEHLRAGTPVASADYRY